MNDTTFVQLVWQQFWQCSLLVLVVYLICKPIRFRRAHLTFLLWFLVVLKFMTPPLWSSSSGLFCWVQESLSSTAEENPSRLEQRSLTLTESIRLLIGDDMQKLPDVDANASRMKITVHDGAVFEKRNRSSEVAAILPESAVNEREQPAFEWTLMDVAYLSWAFVSALIMTVMGICYGRCWMILRQAGEQHRPELDQLLVRLCAELHLKRRVRLMITNSRMGPAVIGLFRPTIILPTAITDARSLQELEPILAHELIHIRRGDLWIGLLQLLASVVWWFHPLVWFTGRRLKLEIEQCCDEEVLAGLNCDPRMYASCLLEVLELKQTLNTVPVVPGVRPVEITSKRLERIMKLGHGCQKRTPWWCWMIFVTLAAVVLPGAAFVVTAADPPKVLRKFDELAADSVNQQNDFQQPGSRKNPSPRSVEKLNDLYKSTDIPYLASEINVRNWIARSSKTQVYPVGALLQKASKIVGIMQAERYLLYRISQEMQDRSETASGEPGLWYESSEPFFVDEVQIPWKDERKLYRMRSFGWKYIQDDKLYFYSSVPANQAVMKQLLDELTNLKPEVFTSYELRGGIVSVPQALIRKLSRQQKNVKVYQVDQVPDVVESESSGDSILQLRRPIILSDTKLRAVSAETVKRTSVVFEVLDEKRFRELQRVIQSVPECERLSNPIIRFLDGQRSEIQIGNPTYYQPNLALNKLQHSDLYVNTGLKFSLTYSERKGVGQRGMLEYQVAYSAIEGQFKERVLSKHDDQEQEIELPLVVERQFKDVCLIQPGQALLVTSSGLHRKQDDSNVLVVLFQLQKAQPVQAGQVLHGVGVNSDADVTGYVELNDANARKNLLTITYPVADLVVPLPRKIFLEEAKPRPAPLMPQPRFEPLIELIKQNVTPEAWDDSRETYSTIRGFPKMLSLVVRHTREGHEKLTELLMKLRAVQDRQVCLEVQLITADDLPAWLETWNKAASPVTQDLWTLLKTNQLDEGIQLSSIQRGLLMQMSERGEHVNRQHVAKVTTFNGQPAILNLFGLLPPDETPKALVQLRPELLQHQRLRLSFVINPQNALDTISHLKNATIPEGKSLLVDITDQLSRDDSTYLFDQFVRQAELSYQKQAKRCFLLVTPTVLNVSDAAEERAIFPRPSR